MEIEPIELCRENISELSKSDMKKDNFVQLASYPGSIIMSSKANFITKIIGSLNLKTLREAIKKTSTTKVV